MGVQIMELQKSKAAKFIWPATLTVASVLFGWHAGGGFATGNQANQFYVITGWFGPLSAILALLLLTLAVREAMIMYNQNKMTSYKQLFETLYHPFDKLELVFEVYFYIMILMAISASIAGTGKMFQDIANISYPVAIGIVGVVLLVLTMFGAELVRKASTIMTVLILITAISIFIVGIAQKGDAILQIFAQGPSWKQLPLALLKAFQYAGFQCAAIPTMIAVGTVLATPKDSKKSMWIAFALSSLVLCLSVVMLLGWNDVYSAVEGGSTIPTLTVAKQLGSPILIWAYYICLFLCFVSTAVAAIFGVVGRFSGMKAFVRIKNEKARYAFLSAVVMLISMGVSLAGLTNIIKYGYGYCGYVGIAFIVIPFLTVGVYKNRKTGKLLSAADVSQTNE
jgi:uncharacterized membrane protein YkvI